MATFLNDDGTTRTMRYADPFIDNTNKRVVLFNKEVVQVKKGETWEDIPSSLKDIERVELNDANCRINVQTFEITRLEPDQEIPEGTVGMYSFVRQTFDQYAQLIDSHIASIQ